MRLETRVADAQRLEWALRQRIEELERRLRDMGQPMPTPAVQPTASVPPLPSQEVRRTDGDEFAAVLHQSILREQSRVSAEPSQSYVQPQSTAVPAPPMPTNPVAIPMQQTVPLSPQHPAVMQDGVRQKLPQQPPSTIPAAPPLSPTPVAPPPSPPPTQLEDVEEPIREDESIIKARALLRAGRTIEQVARETGVEIGALRLMKQMTQRD